MRQREKDDLDASAFQVGDLRRFKLDLAGSTATIQPRKNIGRKLTGRLPRSESHNLYQRMLRQAADKLFPRIAGGTEDSSIQFVHRMSRKTGEKRESEDGWEWGSMEGKWEGGLFIRGQFNGWETA